jgi:nitrite reductase/ring-hydroxylating ferredoxin subunit
VLDRGLYFAKLEPQRSYALAFTDAEPPVGMFLSVGSDSRSVRDALGESGTRQLLVGGAGHSVGRASSEREHVDRLREWTARHFPGAVETHQWSAQDYRSHDAVPYVGKLPRGFGRIYLATGFDKWGMTNGVAAARAISGDILGEQPGWAKTMGRRITGPSGAAHIAAINLKVGLGLVKGATERLTRRDAHDVVPVCTHLGGLLHWNDCEESWDCPLHGSRFAPDGEVLEGPATRPLRRKG